MVDVCLGQPMHTSPHLSRFPSVRTDSVYIHTVAAGIMYTQSVVDGVMYTQSGVDGFMYTQTDTRC